MNGLNLSTINNAMLGSTQISALYYGSLKLWEYVLLSDAWYLGSGNDDEIQDQEYINSLIPMLDRTDKPTTLNFIAGYNILLTPISWGIPQIYADTAYTMKFTPYPLDELGIENPEGYIISVIECDIDASGYIKEWI